MPEQFELNFDAETPEEESARLSKEYNKKVGVIPGIMMTKDAIIEGINNPNKERARLLAISNAEDEEEMKRTYRR